MAEEAVPAVPQAEEVPDAKPAKPRPSRNSVNQVDGLNTFRASMEERSATNVRASYVKLNQGAFDLQDIGLLAKKAKDLMQKSALASSTHIVERETVKSVIEENSQRFAGCLMLPITILFFIFYAGAAVLHEDIAYTHLIESPFRDTFAPMLDEEGGESPDDYADVGTPILQGVLTVENFWAFMSGTFVPTMFSDVDENGRALPPSKYGRAFMYNQLLGAVVLEQQRSIVKVCEDELAEHMDCYPSKELSNANFGRPWDKAQFDVDAGGYTSWMGYPNSAGQYDHYRTGNDPIIACDDEGFSTTPCPVASERRLELLRDELWAKMPKLGDEEDTFEFFLFQNQPQERIQQRVQYLKDRGFFDIKTNRILVKALVLNNELDIPRVDSIRIVFFQSRGGGIYTMLRMESIFLQSYSRALSYVYDALFVFLLICSTLFSMFQLAQALYKRRVRYYFDLINVVVWINIVIGWFNIVGFASFASSRKDVAAKMEAVLSENTRDNVIALNKAADDFVYFAGWFRVFVADAHIIFMLRCFIALQWQPRLAVVTQTLKETTVDLFHFLIVFVPTFVAFAIAGNQMFGRRMQEFATMEGAIALCFKIAMESEFDWWTFSGEDFRTAMTWVWLYILLVVLLMMNMVLAIIMEVYSVIRLQAGNSETIWANVVYLVRRAILAKSWVKDKVLLERVGEMPRILSQAELKRHVPELSDFQLRRIMQGCSAKAVAVMRMGVHEAMTAQMTAGIKLGLDSIQKDLEELKSKGWMGRGVEAGSLPNRVLAQDILQSAAIQTHWMNLMQTQLDNLRKKTHGLSDVANLLITIYSATGILAINDMYVQANITGLPDKKIATRCVSSTSDEVEWDEEQELTGYIPADGKGLEFSIWDDGESVCICMMYLQAKDFYPDGWEGTLAFPGKLKNGDSTDGTLGVKIEIVNPLAETTV
mmetsp:Transcript_91430/g.167795  ORF Transcript_91430/g.167795 Transcript_91430/m.167795 type:complete len:935 (+) Transcript_91430:104-2908(+)